MSPAFHLALLSALALAPGGCTTPHAGNVSTLAASAGIHEQLVDGTQFRHRLFANTAARSSPAQGPLLVFLEGDGSPWTHGGRRVASDPSPRQPLAFHLFAGTQLPAWYITRPCYSGLGSEACRPELWTSGRYSEEVVRSLATALHARLRHDGHQRVVLVGYSGGGVLATLLAPRLAEAIGVVTVAANLDVGAWSRLHGYLPLDQSLDPAQQPGLPDLPQVLLTGARDTNVPLASVAAYLERNPRTTVITHPRFDHRCCWVEQWSAILPEALRHIVAD